MTEYCSPPWVLAGTESAGLQALWQQAQPHIAPLQLVCTTASASNLDCATTWRGTVFWLPTPAHAPPAERHTEQQWRQQLLLATQHQGLTLRLLYGQAPDQCRALLACLQAASSPARPPADLPMDSMASAHSHPLSVRCRECVDPASERKLFSHLLSPRPQRQSRP